MLSLEFPNVYIGIREVTFLDKRRLEVIFLNIDFTSNETLLRLEEGIMIRDELLWQS